MEQSNERLISIAKSVDVETKIIEENGEDVVYFKGKDIAEIAEAFSEKSTITSMITKFAFGTLELSDIKKIIDNYRKTKV